MQVSRPVKLTFAVVLLVGIAVYAVPVAYHAYERHTRVQAGVAKLMQEAKDAENAKKRLTQMVIDNLVDPDSAKFRDAHLFHGRLKSDGPIAFTTLCGQVNAKNSLGGYSGYHRFFSTLTFKNYSSGTPFPRVMIANDGDEENESLHEIGRDLEFNHEFNKFYHKVCSDAEFPRTEWPDGMKLAN